MVSYLLFRIVLILFVFLSSSPARSASTQLLANNIPLNITSRPIIAENIPDDEDDWDDEEDWDEDWEDCDEDDEDCEEWYDECEDEEEEGCEDYFNEEEDLEEVEEEAEAPIPPSSISKAESEVKFRTPTSDINDIENKLLVEEDLRAKGRIKEVEVKLDPEYQKILEESLQKTRIVTGNQTINKLFSLYGDSLQGLDPNDPVDLKEINKLLEIVGPSGLDAKPRPRPKPVVKKDDPEVNFSARNITVRDSFATLARISGKSITVSGAIQDRDTISVIEINNQPFTQAFLSMVQAAGVDYIVSGDNYTVLKKSGGSKKTIFSLEPTEVDLELPLLERYADLAYDNEDINTIIKDLTNKYGIDIVLTAAPTERITIRARNVNVEEALRLILSGSAFDFIREQDKFVVYNKVNKNFSLDKKIVLFQVKYLEAKEITNLLPQDIKGIVKVSEPQNALLAEGSKEELTRLFEFLRAIDLPIHQVELDVKLVEVSKSFTQSRNAIKNTLTFGRIGRRNNGGGFAGTGFESIKFGSRTIDIFATRPSVSQNRTLGEVKVSQRLTAGSGKTAKLNFDVDQNILLGQGSGAGQGGVVQSQSLTRITAGTSMSITPVVGDNGVITVKVEVEVSENGAPDPSTNVPTSTTRRRISSELQVVDHETIAIGGLFQDNNSVNGNEVPLLNKVPILGNLFGNRTKSNNDRELIVLITPHVKNSSDILEEKYVQAEAK
jgi:hypothetical protein